MTDNDLYSRIMVYMDGYSISLIASFLILAVSEWEWLITTSWFKSWARNELWEVLNRNAWEAQMLSLSKIWIVNTVWTYRFSCWCSCFLASVLSCVFTVRYWLSFWSTQFPRKAAFIFKAYQSVHSVCYAWRHVPGFYCNLLFMFSELSRPSLRIHFTFNLMIQEVIQSFCCYQAARRKGKFMTFNFCSKYAWPACRLPLPRWHKL